MAGGAQRVLADAFMVRVDDRVFMLALRGQGAGQEKEKKDAENRGRFHG